MTTYRFAEIGHVTARKNVACAGGCGKKVRRQQTFVQTANPWNLNAAGDIKTYGEAYRENQVKAEAWKAEPETCAACREAGAS